MRIKFLEKSHTPYVPKPVAGNKMQLTEVLIISLDRSLESRYEPLRERMKSRGVLYNATKITAIDGRDLMSNPSKLKRNTYACLLSHIKAIENARDRNLPCVLIIEDDVDFVSDFTESVTRVMEELPTDWDALWLGGRNVLRPEQYSDSLYRMIGSWGAYGYVLHSKMYDRLIAGLKKEMIACDDYYRRIHIRFKCYRPKRDLVIHMQGYSDRQEVMK